ncbi:MAG TPA: cytochrome P450 [Candidatus Dormibacteraeota bacterium]|nr:cytochrome P450 [Candidatus Dormibacteraeota bacterium]
MDPFVEDFVLDPYPHYARVREGASAQREVQPSGMVSWLVPSYEHGRRVLTDAQFSSSFEHAEVENLRRGGLLDSAGDTTLGPAMILSDPPVHTRLRGLVSRSFTPGRVEALRPRVQEIADQLLEAMAPRGRADLIADFAEPLPVTVMCELLGVDPQSHGDFREWVTAMLTTPTSPETRELKHRGARALAGYLGELVASRQAQVDLGLEEAAQPDLVRALIRAHHDEGALSPRELVGMMMQLLIAGYETTRNLIGNGMLALFRHPEQLALLRERPDLLPSAVEELLRFESPVPRASYRVAKEDVEVGGVRIPAGSLVSVLIAAANRDAHRFADPDRLDITRPDNQHLAFAYGIHYCLGAPLARVEGAVAIGSLLARLRDVRLAAHAELRWRSSSLFVRGLETLPIEFTASAT